MHSHLLQVRNLGVRYGSHVALSDVSFTVGPGEIVALIGPNGAGKSSLLKGLVGLVPVTGSATFHGDNCVVGNDRLCAAYIPQRNEIDHAFPIDVLSIVLSGRRPFGRRFGWPSAGDRPKAEQALDRVALGGFGHRPVAALSGGELQRVFLARALVQGAEVLLLDEALSGVDRVMTEALMQLFVDLAARGTSVIVATHDLALARHRFDRCLAINRTLVADGPPSEALVPELLDVTFGSGVATVSMLAGGPVVPGVAASMVGANSRTETVCGPAA